MARAVQTTPRGPKWTHVATKKAYKVLARTVKGEERDLCDGVVGVRQTLARTVQRANMTKTVEPDSRRKSSARVVLNQRCSELFGVCSDYFFVAPVELNRLCSDIKAIARISATPGR